LSRDRELARASTGIADWLDLAKAPGLAGVLLLTLALASSMAQAAGRKATIARNTFACTEWAGWHEYTLASLTPQGVRPGPHCPIRIGAGAKVEVVEEADESGAAQVKYRGKIWTVDAWVVQ